MWALLLACREDPVDLEPPPEPPATTDTAAPAARFPTEALDLDPAPDAVRYELRAEVVGDGFGYATGASAATTPGPTLRARLGDRVVVDITNDLGVPTTVHWHGVNVPAAADGAGWPLPEIAPGGSFRAEFTADRAGTFWYHPHMDTEHQVDGGLFGAFVVEDPADPPVDADVVMVLDTRGEPEAADSDVHLVDPALADWLVNGLSEPVYDWPSGATVRARFVNAANTGYAWLRRQETVVAHDQGLLPRPETGDVLLGPGDRAEVVWRVGDGGFDVMRGAWAVAGGAADDLREDRVLLTVASDDGAPPAPLDWPDPDPPDEAPRPSPDPGVTTIRYLLTGSPEGGWEINGETFPDVTVAELALGEVAVIEVRNASPASHPFHVHGQLLEVLSVDGVRPEVRTYEDTVDVPIRSTVRLRLVADNPGLWMTHCHVLPHADDGMMTLLRVE